MPNFWGAVHSGVPDPDHNKHILIICIQAASIVDLQFITQTASDLHTARFFKIQSSNATGKTSSGDSRLATIRNASIAIA